MSKRVNRAIEIFVCLVMTINIFRTFNIITLTEGKVGVVLSLIVAVIYFVLSMRKKQNI